MTARRASLAAFSTALLLGLAWGCSAADNSSGFAPGGGGSSAIGEAGIDGQVLSPDGAPVDDGGSLVLNPLCGTAHNCVPDQVDSCRTYAPPVLPSGDASLAPPDASLSSQAGASGAGGEGGDAPSVAPGSGSSAGEGGASGAAGEAGSSAEGGSAGAPLAAAPKFGCQVQRVPGSLKSVVSACAVVGVGGANAPCLTSSDCQAGFGCVGDQSAGLCEQYCCHSGDQCQAGTYCAERPMRDAVTNTLAKGSTDTSRTLMIPVCVPAENCDLNAPYPCTSGTQCACKSGTACLVVRSDGTTTCAVPGTGKVGGACPCAWGLVCSAATSQCLQLCYTRGAATCGDGKCQAASELPDGWGVCVGTGAGGG